MIIKTNMPTVDTSTATAIAWAKLTSYLSIAWVFEFLNIPQMQITILAFLMLLDVITGVMKQYSTDPSGITSKNLGLGLMKKVTSMILLVAVGVSFKAFWLDPLIYVKFVLGILIMSEFYSILQNAYAIRTGTILPEYDVISKLIKSLGTLIQWMLDKAVNNIPNKK